MKPIRFLAVATVVATIGCSERTWPTASGPNDTQPPVTPASAQVTGFVIVRTDGSSRSVHVRTPEGSEIRMVGTEAARLASVDGGEVLVRGTWDASPGLVVERFQVLAMNGRAALDGVLVDSEAGLALVLSDGTLRVFADPPVEIAELIGARLWVTGLEEPPLAFGVIDAI